MRLLLFVEFAHIIDQLSIDNDRFDHLGLLKLPLVSFLVKLEVYLSYVVTKFIVFIWANVSEVIFNSELLSIVCACLVIDLLKCYIHFFCWPNIAEHSRCYFI